MVKLANFTRDYRVTLAKASVPRRLTLDVIVGHQVRGCLGMTNDDRCAQLVPFGKLDHLKTLNIIFIKTETNSHLVAVYALFDKGS